LETAIGFSSWTSAQWLADHEEPTRQGSRHRQSAPYQRMRTKDGYLMVGAAGQSIWARCAAALGHPEWCEDPRFATNQQRMQVRHRGLVQYAHIRTPVKIGESVRVRTVAPKLGQHNAEILGRLGLNEAETKDLRARGVA
jgi:crotonobetainyl-CoA:carnitine CoA-transferase CaiB-like acyl-CoA transferase